MTDYVPRAEKVSDYWQFPSIFFKTLLMWTEEYFEESFFPETFQYFYLKILNVDRKTSDI